MSRGLKMSTHFTKSNLHHDISKILIITRYDILYFFRYKTNIIWLIATPLVFTMTGLLLTMMFGEEELTQIIKGNTSGPAFVLVGYLVFSFANYGWQINNKIEREFNLGTLQYNFLLPYKKHLYMYGLCLGTVFSNGLFNGILLIVILLVKSTSPQSILSGIFILLLILIVYLGISLIMSGITLRAKKLGSLTNILTFVLQFLNGMVIPLRVFPASVRSVLQFLPTSLAIDTFRSTALHLEPLYDKKMQILILMIYAGVFNIAGIMLVKHAIRQIKVDGSLELY